MPFIEQDARKRLANGGMCETPGDICYLAYKEMLRQWNKNPRWTTVHYMRRNILDIELTVTLWVPQNLLNDIKTATYLAFDVFFQTHVMPYEIEKRILNGDVE